MFGSGLDLPQKHGCHDPSTKFARKIEKSGTANLFGSCRSRELQTILGKTMLGMIQKEGSATHFRNANRLQVKPSSPPLLKE